MTPIPCVSLAMTIVLCIVIGIIFYAIRKIIEKTSNMSEGAKTAMSVIRSILCLGLWIWFFFGLAYAHPNGFCDSTVSFRPNAKWL